MRYPKSTLAPVGAWPAAACRIDQNKVPIRLATASAMAAPPMRRSGWRGIVASADRGKGFVDPGGLLGRERRLIELQHLGRRRRESARQLVAHRGHRIHPVGGRDDA